MSHAEAALSRRCKSSGAVGAAGANSKKPQWSDRPVVTVNQSEDQYQDAILPGVSRTFALTIPQLPSDLRRAVTNAYLLCRIADTIEDDPGLEIPDKERFHEQFRKVVAGTEDAAPFARALLGRMSDHMSANERDLVGNTDRVVAVTHALRPTQRRALLRCVEIMSEGMREFERKQPRDGVADLTQLDRYCYYVAGVVGEMLTELFCDYCPEMAPHRDRLMRLGVSFGQGLQMTNVLKDAWDDRLRGACWLPRDIFLEEGFDLTRLSEKAADDPAFRAGVERLVGIAHQHLRNALDYVLTIPPEQTGMRRFCLWALGMALLTLQKVHKEQSATCSKDLKISRRAVRATIMLTNLATAHDTTLALMFRLTARNLPSGPAVAPATRRPAS